MRYSLRLSINTFALALLAACSHSSDQPALSDDLKQDLAKAGGSDVLLAGTTAPKLDVVSASERTPSAIPAPSASHGNRAVVRSIRRNEPAAVQATPRAIPMR